MLNLILRNVVSKCRYYVFITFFFFHHNVQIDIGVYGDVLRVKILYNKKDCALIQMAEPQQAQLGT